MFDTIIERQIAEGRERGAFDGLAGAGRPIPDLDRPRRPGWWAEQFVKRERHELRREEIVTALGRAMPPLWRLADCQAVTDRVTELNAEIAEYNRVTTVAPVEPLDPAEVLATWQRLRTNGEPDA